MKSNKDKTIEIDTRMSEILDIMKKFNTNRLFGGFEVKYEAGKITFIKDWIQRKF